MTTRELLILAIDTCRPRDRREAGDILAAAAKKAGASEETVTVAKAAIETVLETADPHYAVDPWFILTGAACLITDS